MVHIRMVTLGRAKNGDWFTRKGIPAELREAYGAVYGPRREELFRRPPSVPLDTAKQELRDWDAEITSRISQLRAQARGDGEPMLLPRQAHALAGEWYNWFVAQYDADPGTPEQWEVMADEHEDVCLRFSPRHQDSDPLQEAEPRSPRAQRAVREFVAAKANVAAFLYAKGRSLSEGATRIFLDALEADFIAALKLLRRRAEGDYAPDPRPATFPVAEGSTGGSKTSGLTAWAAFELWIETRKPAASSVNRWRAVFVGLREQFGERDIATITAEEAQGWIDGLPNEERSPHTVQEIWLRAARTVFAWAVKKKRLDASPFAGASMPVPKKRGVPRRKHFRDDEWRTILRATLEPPPPRLAAHNAAARRWVPWICAYTGSRPGEACQLRAEDVYQDAAGVWAMRITPDAGTVKDDEVREVPLHDDLVQQGFAEFVKSRRRGPLFYDPQAQRKEDTDPTNPKRPPYVTARQKLADWTNTLGLDLTGLSPTHAWRHTFVYRARAAGLDRSVRFAMCGHADSDEGDDYAPMEVGELAEAMKKFPRYEV